MANVQFFKGTTVPTTNTLADGGIYFNTSNKFIYINDGGTLVLWDGNNSIPTVNNGKLTIQKNSDDVGTFTANQPDSSTVNIIVPTKVSDLEGGPDLISRQIVKAFQVNAYDGYYLQTQGGDLIPLPIEANVGLVFTVDGHPFKIHDPDDPLEMTWWEIATVYFPADFTSEDPGYVYYVGEKIKKDSTTYVQSDDTVVIGYNYTTK